jgi:hypothetical protein
MYYRLIFVNGIIHTRPLSRMLSNEWQSERIERSSKEMIQIEYFASSSTTCGHSDKEAISVVSNADEAFPEISNDWELTSR